MEQTISISGGSSATSVFIYAPDATVGINGGSGDGDFKAVIWANTWDASNSGNAEVIVPNNADTLITSEYWPSYTEEIGVRFNRITGRGGWERQAVSD